MPHRYTSKRRCVWGNTWGVCERRGTSFVTRECYTPTPKPAVRVVARFGKCCRCQGITPPTNALIKYTVSLHTSVCTLPHTRKRTLQDHFRCRRRWTL